MRRDARGYALLAAFCLLLFGYSAFSGRPLTMHEARLPQTAREMAGQSDWRDWVVPTSGGRPWPERPPGPHWVVVAAMAAAGESAGKSAAVARLCSALVGTLTVLLTAATAGRLLGRKTGLLSGFLLATSFEFYSYSSLAEDDVYLAALVALALLLFVRVEFGEARDGESDRHLAAPLAGRGSPTTSPASGAAKRRPRFEGWTPSTFGARSWSAVGFFTALGLTSLTKGPLMGPLLLLPPLVLFIAFNSSTSRKRWAWPWGWLVLIALTLAWPLAAWRLRPDVLGNWKFDYLGRLGEGYEHQPWWYYLHALPGAILPWTPAALLGLLSTARRAWRDPRSPQRLVWLLAFVPATVLSIPQGKHHHYLVPVLGAWAVLSAVGLREVAARLLKLRPAAWSTRPIFGVLTVGLPVAALLLLLHAKLPGPLVSTILLTIAWVGIVVAWQLGFRRREPRLLLTAVLATVAVGYCYGQSYLAAKSDQTLPDTAFALRVGPQVPAGAPLLLNSNDGSLDFFRLQFYLPDRTRLLQNLTYLRSDALVGERIVYVISRAADAAELGELGKASVVDVSRRSHGARDKAGNFALFRLRFDPSVERGPPPPVSSLQAMHRDPGPFLGPEL